MITLLYKPKDGDEAIEQVMFNLDQQSTYTEMLAAYRRFLCAVGYADYGVLVADPEAEG